MNVLLVDDEYIVLKGMEAMLLAQKDLDLQIFTAGDAFEGLEKIPAVRPDAVIADVNMPEMDGLEMMAEARRRGYQGKFLIVSGYERVDYLKRAIQQQAVDYLLKPVDKALLLEKLREIAAEKERQSETLLFKLKMCMLENRHKSDLPISPAEVRALLPCARLRLCAAGGEEEAMLARVERAAKTYFEVVLRFSQNQLAFFLLNSDRSFTREETLEILRQCSGGDVLWGMSGEREVGDFAALIAGDGVSSVYGEALRDWVCGAVSGCAPASAALPAFHSFETVLGASRDEKSLQSYADSLLREAASLQEAHYRAFVEIACYHMTIFGSPFTPEALRANYRAQAQYIVDGQSFFTVLRNILFRFSCYAPDAPRRERYSEKIYQAVPLHSVEPQPGPESRRDGERRRPAVELSERGVQAGNRNDLSPISPRGADEARVPPPHGKSRSFRRADCAAGRVQLRELFPPPVPQPVRHEPEPVAHGGGFPLAGGRGGRLKNAQ